MLNEPEAVRSATRRRVERAIAKLGYRRSNAARSLRTRSTRTIGVVAPGTGRSGPRAPLRRWSRRPGPTTMPPS
ncbi:LacI family DNA-binding transcriptional regulator [Nesterenkonia pannonica]|uniref:LacI family DNA-binding transcriptional regulator n=1 Tax=Nesterenkonia pannonica TaxID=1548602 RepID=UPI0021640EF8|nr:LacI family DNA-binding transcriptional regulator [Nesterenkonia pannonica]